MSKITITYIKNIINRSFPQLWMQVEACLATIATLLLEDNTNPIALILVGSTSSGKSIVLSLLNGSENLVANKDLFNSNDFLSKTQKKPLPHLVVNKDRPPKLKIVKSPYAHKDILQLDLNVLKRINNKCLIISDMGTTFTKDEDNLEVLTRILDEDRVSHECWVHSEADLMEDYRLAMLSATTPLSYQAFNKCACHESKLLFIKSDIKPKGKIDSKVFINKVVIYKQIISFFVSDLFNKNGGCGSINWKIENTSKAVLELIKVYATMLVRLRGIIPVGEDKYPPCFEDSKKVLAQLLNLAKGRAIIYGRNQISMEDIPMLREIVLSSCPDDLGRIMRRLLEKKEQSLTTKEVCQLLKISEKLALNLMEDLETLKLVCKEESYWPDGSRQTISLNWYSLIKDTELIFTENYSKTTL